MNVVLSMQHILAHLYPLDEVCGCLHISHLWPMDLYLWSISIHETMFHPIGPSNKHEGLDRRMVYENKDGWKKWNLTASWIFMPTLFYVALKCPSGMKVLEIFGWNQTDFMQICFDALGKVLGFGGLPQNRVLCKPLSVCVGGMPEPHRPAGSQSAEYSSGEEKS